MPKQPKKSPGSKPTDSTEFIEPAKLKLGTMVYLETNSTVYELEILEDNRAFISSSNTKVRKVPCTIIGSVKIGPVFAGKILKDHHLVVSLPKKRFTTGLIRGATVSHGKWRYDLWKE